MSSIIFTSPIAVGPFSATTLSCRSAGVRMSSGSVEEASAELTGFEAAGFFDELDEDVVLVEFSVTPETTAGLEAVLSVELDAPISPQAVKESAQNAAITPEIIFLNFIAKISFLFDLFTV